MKRYRRLFFFEITMPLLSILYAIVTLLLFRFHQVIPLYLAGSSFFYGTGWTIQWSIWLSCQVRGPNVNTETCLTSPGVKTGLGGFAFNFRARTDPIVQTGLAFAIINTLLYVISFCLAVLAVHRVRTRSNTESGMELTDTERGVENEARQRSSTTKDRYDCLPTELPNPSRTFLREANPIHEVHEAPASHRDGCKPLNGVPGSLVAHEVEGTSPTFTVAPPYEALDTVVQEVPASPVFRSSWN